MKKFRKSLETRRQQKLEKERQKLLSAEESILNDLFNDMYVRRYRVYRVAFTRGVFFGLGTFLGGTIIVALLIAFFNLFTQLPAGVGDFFRGIIDALRR